MFDDWKPVGAKAVARWFINHADRDAGEAITQLKLQKLEYYANAWFLANFDNSLIEEDFEAWAHGPVVRFLYAKYRNNGWEALAPEKGPGVPKDVDGYLEAVFDECGQFSAKKLEKMTHSEHPWVDARGDLPPEAASNAKISKLLMRNYYGAKIDKEPIQAF